VWRSFEEIGAEAAEKKCLGKKKQKNSTQTQRATITTLAWVREEGEWWKHSVDCSGLHGPHDHVDALENAG